MKIICSQILLNDAISMAQKAIATRSPQPILEGLLFEAERDSLTITGYDLQTGIECKVDADIMKEGRIVIDAKMIGDIVRKLPEDLVTIDVDDHYLIHIHCGKAKFKIKGKEASDFPKIPIVEQEKQLVIAQKVFREMILQTIFATSTDENRPILNGIKVTAKENHLELVAIDGFRLAVRRADFADSLPEMSFIVPGKSMRELTSILEISDKPVKIYLSENHILFDSGNEKLVSRLLQGDYMDYHKILPTEANSIIFLQKEEMLRAIERASLIMNVEQRRFPFTLKNIDQKTLTISSQTDIGAVNEEILIDLSGENIDTDYNPKYFLDVLRNIPEEKVKLEFSGNFGPCLIKPLEGERFLYLVLPLRR